MMTEDKVIPLRYAGWCPNSGAMVQRLPLQRDMTVPDGIPIQPDSKTGGRGRINRGISFAIGSVRFLLDNKWLLWFSLCLLLVSFFSFTSTMAIHMPAFNTADSGKAYAAGSLASPLWFGIYFIVQVISEFFVVFITIAIITCIFCRISGHPVTIWEGFLNARRKIRFTLGYVVLIAALMTVHAGVFVQAMQPVSFILGIVIFGIFGLVTMFVVPILVFEGHGLFRAIRESYSLMMRTWGETAVSFGLFMTAAGGIMALSTLPMIAAGSSASPVVFALSTGIFFVCLTASSIIVSTLGSILLVSLYLYGRRMRTACQFSGYDKRESLS